MIASSGSTPEWLATTSAAPVPGTWPSPRISTRNHCWYSSRASGISSRELNSGSKPNSSTSPSPVSWRRANRSASPSRPRQSSPPLPAGGGPGNVPDGSSPVLPSQPTVLPFLAAPSPAPRAGLQISPRGASAALLLVAPLHTRLAQQLAVLLLRHPLTALLDDRAHDTTLTRDSGQTGLRRIRPMPAGWAHANAPGYLPRACPGDVPSGNGLSWPRRMTPSGSGSPPARERGMTGPPGSPPAPPSAPAGRRSSSTRA